ncbi:MAG: hypothetical protein ACOYMB_01895 [Patescibacteria group bacterium]
MKKILLSMSIFSLIFAFANVTSAQEREKISSPDQIKFFQGIKKEGASLFGVRKAPKVNEQKKVETNKPENIKIEATSTTPMEKISSPSEISLFNKIIKKGAELWGMRKNVEKKVEPAFIKPEIAQCIKTAIDKKDAALKVSNTTHNEKILSSIDGRNVCQKTALDKTNAKEQVEANKTCVIKFQNEIKENNEAMNKEKAGIQKVQQDEFKACLPLQGEKISTSNNQSPTIEIKIEDGETLTETIR